MSVKCGNRRVHGTDTVHHATVADVRACFFSGTMAAVTQPDIVDDFTFTPPAAPTPAGIHGADYAAWATIPVYGPQHRAHYALVHFGETAFYRAERPAAGKWAGKTFLSRQRGDDFVRPDWIEVVRALNTIATDPDTAGSLYGREIGSCYRCHRTLTTTTSRAAGIGPDCAKKG